MARDLGSSPTTFAALEQAGAFPKPKGQTKTKGAQPEVPPENTPVRGRQAEPKTEHASPTLSP